MSNYTKEDRCVGCDSHISEYHNTPCVYDPDFEPIRRCVDCGYKLDDGYTQEEIQCGACYNLSQNIDQDDPYCGDCLVLLKDCAHLDTYKKERESK